MIRAGRIGFAPAMPSEWYHYAGRNGMISSRTCVLSSFSRIARPIVLIKRTARISCQASDSGIPVPPEPKDLSAIFDEDVQRQKNRERRHDKWIGRGPRQGRDTRTCIVSRERHNRYSMWRVVRILSNPEKANQGRYQIRIQQGNGRSVFVKRDVETLELAKKRRTLGKALKCDVPMSIYDELIAMTIQLESAKESQPATV